MSGWVIALRATLVLLVRAAEIRSFVLEDAAKHQQNQELLGLALGAWVGAVPVGCAWRGARSCWWCGPVCLVPYWWCSAAARRLFWGPEGQKVRGWLCGHLGTAGF